MPRAPAPRDGPGNRLSIGGRSDGVDGWEGRREVAILDRALRSH